MKVDLVMWAKNGSKCLPYVLHRVEKVIPQRNINKRIFVDDHSTDNSVEIAKKFGWEIYENREGGIASGANTALKHVSTQFFVSIEQDVLLAKDWWKIIPKHMKDPNVAVARGIRLPTHPVLRNLYEYKLDRVGESTIESRGIDNNIYRTNIIHELGGFPTECPIFVDAILKKKVIEAGYEWIIDETVISDHIREGVLQEAFHTYKHIMMAKITEFDHVKFSRLLKMFMFSPIRASEVMIKKKCPQIFFAYPFLRFMSLRTCLDRKRLRLGKC